ncbi:LamG-like jellyroll fold domain-containing protein [Plebeiibacterium marinum]|uniref:Alginate lyase family protein n=1 Tax=Plebeiibacterium marinum TaxID=2992111 RepID=A0AAE3MGE3_9BACT|nr:LamG-like jellyroll fold domain-containing protein [Plebeiobacterium marinum]MCW3807513.1 alginate lyase family protein [Plebeiobacterium marinum]
MKICSSIPKIFFLLITISFFNDVNSQGFKHPGLLHTQEDFSRIITQLASNNPAVVAGMTHLRSSEWSQLNVSTWPVEIIKRGIAGDENYINAARGAHIAYMCALRWKLGDGEAYAKKAVEVLNLWAATTTGIGGNSNYALASGIYGYEFANAGELLRDYEGWKPDDFKAFQDWMKGLWYPVALGFLTDRNGTNPGHYWSNWGLCNALTVISIGVLCDDMYIYNQGLSYYKDDYIGTFKEDKTGDDKIINDGYNEFIGNLVPIVWGDDRGPFGQLGQMQESGRDQGHTLMAVGLATDICQVAWNQGEDLFAYMDNRLAAGIEYIAAYNTIVENEDLPWKEYWYHDVRTSIENSWKQTENNAIGRGQHRPYWDRILGYYQGIKGIEMPYASIMASNIRTANGGADFGGGGSTSGGYDHLGYSTLTCTRPAVTEGQVQTSLGMQIHYDGKIYNSTARLSFQPGSIITLYPTLPDTATNSGNWLWDNGSATQQLEINADSSHIYRVYYTNTNGVVSTQSFSILVYGDCPPDVYSYSIISNNVITEDTIIIVQPYSNVNLCLQSLTGQSTYLWNTGETSAIKQAIIQKADSSFTVTGTNKGGAAYQLSFKINVEPIGGRFKINDGDILNGNKVKAVKGQTVTLIPEIKEEIEGGTWKWGDGSTIKKLVIENIQNNAEYTVTYAYQGQTYSISYYIVLVDDASSFAYWPMNNTEGTMLTDVWSGFNATLYNATWTSEGKCDGAIAFDGASSYVHLPDNFLSSLSDFSIAVWVKPETADMWARIWDFGINTDYNMFLTPVSGDGFVRFAIKAGGEEQQVTSTTNIVLNEWTHIAVTKSGNTAKLYVNGDLVGTNTATTISPSQLGFTINNYLGKSQWPDPLFKGSVDELKIFNTAMESTKITELMLCGVNTGMSAKLENENKLSVILTLSSSGDYILLNKEGKHTCVDVFELTGRLVNSFSSNSAQINLNLHSPGLYLVKVVTDCGSQVFKVLKR